MQEIWALFSGAMGAKIADLGSGEAAASEPH